MKQDMIKPDYLFEVSWEACNKVGGIYTVISTKAQTLVNELKNNYILIGPDVWRDVTQNPEFEEDKKLFKSWRDKAIEEGLRVKVGHWKVPGKPIAIIVDFTTFMSQKDFILSDFWEKNRLDSLNGQWDYIEPTLFGYACGKVIESFVKFNLSVREKVVAQFHEWMSSSGMLYLNSNMPNVATVFTTHATVLGRSIAASDQPLYSKLNEYAPDIKAREFKVIAKQSLERASAKYVDCFTTVSELTNNECKVFLEKPVDIVTPNGFDDSLIPSVDLLPEIRQKSRKHLINVAEKLTGTKISNDALIISIGGRYEFKNKGIDLFIDSLKQLNDSQELTKEVIAYILIPANHYGARKDLAQRIENNEIVGCSDCILTHNLHYAENDPILNRLKNHGLTNITENKVKVVFVPSYLNGDDGIFNISYYNLLLGFDITIFPSYYEPWGYTPLESLAFHVPTIITSLTGFGLWTKEHIADTGNGLQIIERTDHNEQEVVSNIVQEITSFSKLSVSQIEEAREKAFEISHTALWKNMIEYYYEAFSIALRKASERSGIMIQNESVDTLTSTEQIINANNASWKRMLVQKNIPDNLLPLEELSKNLWWCWNEDAISMFRSIDPKLWEESLENPIVLLDLITYDMFQSLEKNTDFVDRMNRVFERFKNYMAQPMKPGAKIAYFSMEFGLHDSLKIFSGGLGLLAGDYLKEASDAHANIVGVGLFYRYGYFKQIISAYGDQVPSYDAQTFSKTPAQPVRDSNGNWIQINIIFPGRNLTARVWKVMVGRIPLYLLDTDIEENLEQDRSVTHQLYGGNWENRFKQELLLGIGGIRALDAANENCELFHCNEGHAAFIGIERLRKYIMDKNLTFGEALEIVRASQLFTTHTPVPAGHDAFEEEMVRMYIGHYPNRLNISWEQFISLGRSNPDDKVEKFSMSNLAANLSQEINGVSKLHGRVSQDIFNTLYKGYSPEELHIGYVTNGVHLPTWAAPAWMELYRKTFGDDFLDRQHDREMWQKIYQVPDANIWKIRNTLRQTLIDYIKDYLKQSSIRKYENPRMLVEISENLNKHTLTIGFARRFATYKRAHLLFSDLKRLSAIVNHPTTPVQFLFAGKAHPHDKAGQDLIKMIVDISKKPEFIGKILFLPNYEVKLAKLLVQGVDIWLNTPTRPLEASGTSGEKAVMNGLLHFSVLDGWWAEGYKQDAGWALPEENMYDNPEFQDQLDAEMIYNLLEDEIAPLFYFRNEEGIPSSWIHFIKNSLAKVAPEFTMNRQLVDYINKYYKPLEDRSKRIQENDFSLAKELSIWKKRVRSGWESIEVVSVKYPDMSREAVVLGKNYEGEVVLDLNELAPKDIGVEFVIADLDSNTNNKHITLVQEFELVKVDSRLAYYKINIVPMRSGVFEFGIRVFPKHPELPNRQDFNYIKWLD